MKKALITLIVIIVLAIAYYLISPLWRVVEVNEASPLENISSDIVEEFKEAMEDMDQTPVEMEEEMPEEPIITARGTFAASAHDVSGEAYLIETGEEKIIRFEDFETINGPALHIYLASDLEANDYIDLGEIKATKGNVNYTIPEGIDLDTYNKVLVWCEPFSVLFSYAELK